MVRGAAFFEATSHQPPVLQWLVIVAQLLPLAGAIAVYLLYRRGRLPLLSTLIRRDREAFDRDEHFFAKL